MRLEEMSGTEINSYAPDFELPGVDDEVHHLARYLENYRAVGVIFMCNHCPYVRLYLDRLKELQAELTPQSITLIGINANDAEKYPEDSFENMKAFAKEHELNFPYIRDVTQDVAQSFGATTTPEAFLLDHEGKLRYRGLIDDNANDPDGVEESYLLQAIAQLEAGATINPTTTQAVGCSVKWRE